MFFLVRLFFALLVYLPLSSANPLTNDEDRKFMVFDKLNETQMSMFRLPNDTRPLSYTLQMIPNLTEFVFDGEVVIAVFVRKATKIIHLHCKGLNIKSAQITKGTRKLFPTIQLDPENEILKLESQVDLQEAETYDVHIEFDGILNDDMTGFYRSSYKIGNTTKWLAPTQFEATHARSAFPCYDEPMYRAPFTISIARYKHQKVISNMPLEWTSPPDPKLDNRVWDSFEATPPMPTYLVAFIVCEFSFITDSAKFISVYTRENAVEYAKYALESAKKLLTQMETYTGIQYALPKIDLVAVPDFLAGAMENWGLTTYRERYLLYDPESTASFSKDAICSVIAHELAHQWFGNYVTMSWWDTVWLNEAFATYFETFATAEVEPTWRKDEFFTINVLQEALFVDHPAHSMTWPVKTPKEIDDLFDAIIYDKGASVLRMLEHMVSTPIFKDSLHAYLDKGHAGGGSVTPDILWQAFDDVAARNELELPENTTIRRIMQTWTENQGYPIITVRRIPNENLTTIGIKQETKISENVPKREWIVPLSYMKQYSNDEPSTRPSAWSLKQEEIFLVNETANDEWVLFNINQTGYFRVNYDDENWALLRRQLHYNSLIIPPLSRAQLIDDAFFLAMEDKLGFKNVFEFLLYLDTEEDPIPLIAGIRNLRSIRTSYFDPSYANESDDSLDYFVDRVKPHCERIGFNVKPEDSHAQKIFRTELLRFACELDIDQCMDEVKKQYTKNLKNLMNIQPENREVTFCAVLRTDLREETWNRVWEFYRRSNFPHEKKNVLMSATCSKNNTLLTKYVNKLMNETDTEIRVQDLNQIFKAMFRTNRGVSVALDVVRGLISNTSSISTGGEKRLKILFTSIRGRVRTIEVTRQLKKIVSSINKLKEDRFLKFVPLLESYVKTADKVILNKEKITQLIVDALKNPLEPLPPIPPQPIPPPIVPDSSGTTRMFSKLLFICAVFTSSYAFIGNLVHRSFA